MWRSIAAILAALSASHPGARSQAEVIQKESVERHIDPFTLVAMFHNESGGISTAVGGKDGKCYGLGQHCLFKYKRCRDEGYESPWCLAQAQLLLDPIYNIQETGRDITAWRKFCREKTGRAELHHWLQAYQGYNDQHRGVWCGQHQVKGRWKDLPLPTTTKLILKYRKNLLARSSSTS